ncbi:MAG TPA: PBP1A family penicillin-binding protein [Vulgatibacter sp.]|nr:PBP1A family penicillin-binding protein [Vulgatibacter sp.]
MVSQMSPPRSRRTRRRSRRKSRLPWLQVAAALVAAGAVAVGVFAYAVLADLPSVEQLVDWEPKESTKVFSSDGELIAEFFEERRTAIPPAEIPENLKRAILAAEDSHFYLHDGLDYLGIARTFVKNLTSGRIRGGASTITQQVVKTFLLSPERTYTRKLKEAILARRLEETFSKDEILYLYLTQINFGHGRYGVEEAARFYFGKGAKDLTLRESSLLAGLPQRPAELSPLTHPENARNRQIYVLRQMLQNGWITQEEHDREAGRPIELAPRPEPPPGPYYAEEVRRYLVERYGVERTLTGGLRVTIGMDAKLQRAADAALREGLLAYDERRRPKLAEGEEREPEVQGALVAIDPRTRRVRALVGGWDFSKSSFDRAMQARRQPGSAFKPFVFGAALESGRWTPASLVADTPETFRDPWTGREWKPQNYERNVFEGNMTLRRSLARSKNTVAVRLISELGVDPVIDFARRAGIGSDLPANLTLALGTGEVTPMELANAFATLAAGGQRAEPILVEKVVDRDGTVLEEAQARTAQAISPALSYVLTRLLEAVVTEGTGRAANVLGRPTAGKTGTTSDGRDAWFAGYTADLVAVSWTGFDEPKPLGRGETGGRTAIAAWVKLMKAAHDGLPARDFPRPEGIEVAAIDPGTGLLAPIDAPADQVEWTAFVAGTAPTERALAPGVAHEDVPAELFLGGGGAAP